MQQNLLVESELQDICGFRNSILHSAQKIQNKLRKPRTPLKLNSLCECREQSFHINPFDFDPFNDKTFNYIEENEKFGRNTHQEQTKKKERQKNYLNRYLNEYDLNLGHVKRKTSGHTQSTKGKENTHPSTDEKGNIFSDTFKSSLFEQANMPLQNKSKISRPKRKRNLSSDQITHQIYYEEVEQKNDFLKSLKVKGQSFGKKNSSINKPVTRMSVTSLSSFKNSTKGESTKGSRQKFTTKKSNCSRRPQSVSVESERRIKNAKKNPQKENRAQKCSPQNEILKRIKQRVYLSFISGKNVPEESQMTYELQFKSRLQIVSKIVKDPAIQKKYRI